MHTILRNLWRWAVPLAALMLTAPAAWADCGPGPLVTSSDRSIALQSLGATTNAFFLPTQTLAITSGTSGCSNDGLVLREQEQAVYVATHYEALSEDVAAGGGEHLSALASLMGCARGVVSVLGQVTQRHAAELLPDGPRAPDSLLAAIKRQAARHPRLASGCERLS